jgi:flagellar protein FliO/FliZ
LRILFIVLTFVASTAAWANSDTVNTEDFKPIALEDSSAAKSLVDQAMADATQAAATPSSEVSNQVASDTEVADGNSVASTQTTEDVVGAKATTLAATKDTKGLKESEIPVLTKTVGQKSESKSPWSRLFISFAIISVVGAGLYQAAKWWQKKTAINSDNNRIRVLNQHFLGPRKSLAIIRVAGESILIGVTDQNISLIKSLSLIEDEDIPTSVPQDFAVELNKKEKDDESSWSQVRDRVSTKIKEMRTL